MTRLSKIRNWLFKGLSLESRLDDLESEGIPVRAATDQGALQRVLSIESFSADIRKSSLGNLPAYLAIFCLENSAREIVMERLAENHGADWWESQTSKTMKSKVEDRRKKDGKNRWHTQRSAQPIYYTDFGDLRDLIINNWSDFEDLFPDQHWIANRLNDLEASRNIVAHNNSLDSREVERIKMYLQDWTKQVG